MKKFFTLFILVASVGTFIPMIFVVREAGGWQNWQGVLPKGSIDSLYYYARIHEVVDGYPLIGNPYVYEHKDAFTPAFFLPDIVSALSALMGVPFDAAIVINMFVWSLVFLLLSFALLKLLRMPLWWAFLWSVLMYVASYTFIIRPTILQLIYPVFLAFLIAFLKFLYEPFERRRSLWLSLTAALAFYAYTILAYIVLLVFAFIFFWFLFSRRFKELRALIVSGILALLLLIPFGIYTLLQMGNPYYLETFARLGLAYTHIPTMEVFYYGRWIVIGLITFGLLWFFFPKREEGYLERKAFWVVTGASLFVGLMLNVVTGVDLSLAIHIGRFFFLWMTMILGALLYEWYMSKAESTKTKAIKYITAVFLLALSIGALRNLPQGPSFFEFNKDGSFAGTQSYAGPLNWLEKNVPVESVIWANESVSAYIPIMTRHYPLFYESAALHSMSGKELEDRFLLSHSLNTLTTEDLKRDFGLYAGYGSSIIQPFSQNERAKLCETLARFSGYRECPSHTDAIALRGEEYFKTLAARFGMIKKNQAALLEQYHVTYLIVDRIHDNIDIKQITTRKALYDDGRFVILSVPL